MNADLSEAMRVLALEKDELYLELGEAVDDAPGGFRKSPNELIAIGQFWLSANLSKLRDEFCSNSTVQALRKNDDSIRLVITLSNFVIVPFEGFPTMVVAALLLKIGLDSICEEKPS
jgi:hypothetical protein